ncbi:hypothetical protein J6590_004926 [Homalodisca vitripennis]|nr:hypothetical protein J6590_004926 [Homalodisca vitripennis]
MGRAGPKTTVTRTRGTLASFVHRLKSSAICKASCGSAALTLLRKQANCGNICALVTTLCCRLFAYAVPSLHMSSRKRNIIGKAGIDSARLLAANASWLMLGFASDCGYRGCSL